MCVAHVRTVPHHQNAEKTSPGNFDAFRGNFPRSFNGKNNGSKRNLECFKRNFVAAKLGQIAPPMSFSIFPKSFRKTEIVPPGEIHVLSRAISVLGLS